MANSNKPLTPALANADDGGMPRGGDRRQSSTPRLSSFSFGAGRRRNVRRDEEREGAFVDLYNPWLLALIGWVAVMNGLDSFFTIHHLQSGGIELNPVAGHLLMTGRIGFVLGKAVMITLALLVLTMHKNFVMARIGLFLAVSTYTALVCYHLWLL
jgi:hypothetical protein